MPRINFNAVEYLCKNLRARRGMSWVLSLRQRIALDSTKPRFSSAHISIRENGRGDPPTFYSKDISGWMKRFESTNKSIEEDRENVARKFHYSFPRAEKTSTSFSTLDVLLMQGKNAGEVWPACFHRGSLRKF